MRHHATTTVVRALASTAMLVAALGCGPPEGLEPCNIARFSCQEDIYYALVRMRGDGYDPLADIPPINTLTVAQYRAQLEAAEAERARAQAMRPKPDPDAEPPVNPRDFALQVLGLVTPSMSTGSVSVENRVINVAAFYSGATRSVTVIDRGYERDDFSDTALLLHELTHALQGRELSGALIDGTTDGSLAATTLTEGEATFYQHLSQFEMVRRSPEGHDWHASYTQDLRNGRQRLPRNNSPYFGVRWFVYPLGARFLSDAWERGGNAAVRHAYATQPRHMAHYMTGNDERHARAKTVRDPALRCDLRPPNSDYDLTWIDRFGALIVYSFLTAAEIPDEDAWPLSADWVDDIFYVYFEPDEEIALLSWRIRFSPDADIEALAESLVHDPRVRVQVQDQDLILTAGNDEAVTAEWHGTRDCDAP